MNEGQIVAAGKHEELLLSCDKYKNLWELSEGTKNWSVTSRDDDQAKKEEILA